MRKTLLAVLIALLPAFAEAQVNGGGPTAQPGSAGRTVVNTDRFVSTLDSTANGNTTMFADGQEFDSQVCFNANNSAFCLTTSAATGSAASTTLTGVTLPVYLVAGNLVTVTGTNVAGSSTVTSFTGTPGGTGTITLNNLPTGTVTSINFVQPANVISFLQAGTTSTTVTTTFGSMTLTLGSNSWCSQSMEGTPIYIAGVTAPRTVIAGCLASNKVALSLPVLAAASGATYTIQYGPNFTTNCPASLPSTGVAGCVGSKLIVSGWGGRGNSASVMTIAAVNSASNVVVSVNSAAIVGGAAQHIYAGHDDSTGVNAACEYARANNLILSVPVYHLTTSISRLCYDVILRGAGRLMTAYDVLSYANTVFPEPIVPGEDALFPRPPVSQFKASRDLPNFIAAGAAPSWASTYDSLETGEPNAVNDSDMYPAAFQFEMLRQNPWIAPKMTLCGVGGATMNNFDGNPNATFGTCVTSTGSSFLSQVNTNATPNAVVVGGANNDGFAFAPEQEVDAYLKVTLPSSLGGVMTTPNDWVSVAHHPYSRVTNTGIEDSDEYAAGYHTSFCQVMKCGTFDMAREGIKHLWGYDPLGLAFERAPDVFFGSNILTLPFLYNRLARGFAFTLKQVGVSGNTFWSSFTGGSVTDSRGPFIALNVGYDQGQKNWVWLFQISGNVIGIECDPTNNLPGLGCDNPATGKPPVQPSLRGTITVGSGASPTVTTSATNWGWTCATGATVAIPSAGTAHSVPGYGSYTEPWITTISACNSGTSITVAGTAPQNGAFTNSFVMLGNPVISTGITDSGDGSGNEQFHFEVKGDDLQVWWNNQWQTFNSKIIRPRAAFAPLLLSGGTQPSISLAPDVVTGQETTWQIAKPVVNLTTTTDTKVNGPPANYSLGNSTYTGPSGGDGNNHHTSFYGQLIRALYAASDLSIPSAAGVPAAVVPTTGQTITVPNNASIYTVSPAGTLAALTVNLPLKGYKIGDTLDIAINQIITSLAISAQTGQTITGAAVSALTSTAGQDWRYRATAVNSTSGLVTNWQRVQ